MTSITIEVDDDMFEALKDVAQEEDIPIEETIVRILEIGLFEHDENEAINAD